MNPPNSVTDWIVYLIGTGGLLALGREARQWWRTRRLLNASAPEHRAAAESKMVATAEQVVELVEERMKAQATELTDIRSEVNSLRRRVAVLEAELRHHSIPIPPA